MMELKCQCVSFGEAGEKIIEVLFEAKRDQGDGPYLLISRAFLEEDEGEAGPICVDTPGLLT